MTVLAKSPLFAVLCAVDILTLLSISGRIKTLGELDYSARAEPVAAEGYESLGVVKAADAACGFHFYVASYMLRKELYIIEGCAARREAGRSLYIVGTGARDYIAHCYLLVLGKQAGFDNDLQDFSLARGANRLYLILDIDGVAGFEFADIYNHIYLVRAVCNGIFRLKDLGGGGVIAVRKAYNGAYLHPVPDIIFRSFDKRGRDARARCAEFFGIDKYLFDIAPPGSDPEQGVVDFLRISLMSIFCSSVVFSAVKNKAYALSKIRTNHMMYRGMPHKKQDKGVMFRYELQQPKRRELLLLRARGDDSVPRGLQRRHGICSDTDGYKRIR